MTVTLATIVYLLATAAFARATVEQQIRRAFPDDPDRAVCIALHESTLNPRAVNGSNLGLMQINVSAHPWVDRSRVFAAAYNLMVARRLYLASMRRFGWAGRWYPWTTRRVCGA